MSLWAHGITLLVFFCELLGVLDRRNNLYYDNVMSEIELYGRSYTYITRVSGFLARTLFHFRRTELMYMLHLIKNEGGKKILDYGCNTGYFLDFIDKHLPGNCLYGVDINKYAIKTAESKVNKARFYLLSDWVGSEDKFDIIIISHVLEHISDYKSFLSKIRGRLTDGGKIIIAVPQERIRGDATIVQIFFNVLLRWRFDNPHIHNFDSSQLEISLKDAGFRVNGKSWTNYFPPFLTKRKNFHSWSLVLECVSGN